MCVCVCARARAHVCVCVYRLLQHFNAGMVAGGMTTAIMAPGERIKCLMQVGDLHVHIPPLLPSPLHAPPHVPPLLPSPLHAPPHTLPHRYLPLTPLLQIQQASAAQAKYSGSVDCARQLLREGGIRSLYRGTAATLLRGTVHTHDVPTYAHTHTHTHTTYRCRYMYIRYILLCRCTSYRTVFRWL